MQLPREELSLRVSDTYFRGMFEIGDVAAIARSACAAMMEVYKSDAFDIELKADESPLTRADRESNRVICERLENLNPGLPIVSEESKDIPYNQRKCFDKYWLVDPLDGTKEFIKRNGEFTVNIALISDQVPVLGVVFVPVSGEMYYASKGNGAFLDNGEEVKPLTAAPYSMTDAGLSVVCSRSHINPETQAFIDQLVDPKTISRGSSLKFMLLASGQAHLYPRIAPTMEWDTAAAQCILEEAGGFVVDYESRLALKYNKESLLNPSFLAGGRVRG